jgi:hypothetical protein
VQGRITNATLFPHISAKIQASIDKLVKKTFRDLHEEVNAVLDLIVSDVETALPFTFQRVWMVLGIRKTLRNGGAKRS